MFPRSSIEDDWKFCDVLREHDILAMLGSVLEMSGYFRMSLTTNDDMIERAIPNFKKAYDAVT